MPRPDWDDNRLDDLNRKVDRIDARVDALTRRMDERFDAMNGRLDTQHREMHACFDAQRREMHSNFDAMNVRFDSFQRAMFHAAVALSASILTAGAAIVATQL